MMTGTLRCERCGMLTWYSVENCAPECMYCGWRPPEPEPEAEREGAP